MLKSEQKRRRMRRREPRSGRMEKKNLNFVFEKVANE